MKKIISIKIISLLIIAILSPTLKSCREYDEEIYPEKTNASILKMKNAGDQQKLEEDTARNSPGDPPIKSGTHWKPNKIY
ncbi:hypothetical protein SAMN05421841_3797 [Chryseobacterium wanjuense]|jgi:hypothetical protein|uniref:Uncharacterized protein n=1 Tax=Chryseobacterium wanjuense TaxID=356305 RepID=A0A1I0S1L2_9FLAO|nr:hypothetical protein [Chryseobacterium wanjuense]SEW48333.1 hypothetical protein SAMN05421841_3797 [Chryseobacterium wanjuense]